MARIRPFRGIRYNPLRIKDLNRVVTQPYDKITPEMQEAYYSKDPHNVVRITLGKVEPGDDEKNNRYTRARESLEKWLREGVLLREKDPSLYAYYQTFTPPVGASPLSQGSKPAPTITRKGIIAQLLLEPLGRGVRPHEETLSKPKQDRLNLLRTARVNTGQIFMLYSDPRGELNKILDEETKREPDMDLVAEYGVKERVWVLDNAKCKMQNEKLMEFFSKKELLIADGHHRYETALAFQKECKDDRPVALTGEEDWNFRMVTLISMEDPGLVILPTHRLICGLDRFDLQVFLKKTEKFFKIKPQRSHEELFRLMKGGSGSNDGTTERGDSFRFGIYGNRRFYLLELKDHSIIDQWIKGSAVRRCLDVVVLQDLLIESVEGGLGISEEEVKGGGKIRYIRDAMEGVQAVEQGIAGVCLFLNPTRVEQVREMAERGEKMPQKSTDFYPKLLSGLVMAEA